jgi:hypothetical protein
MLLRRSLRIRAVVAVALAQASFGLYLKRNLLVLRHAHRALFRTSPEHHKPRTL